MLSLDKDLRDQILRLNHYNAFTEEEADQEEYIDDEYSDDFSFSLSDIQGYAIELDDHYISNLSPELIQEQKDLEAQARVNGFERYIRLINDGTHGIVHTKAGKCVWEYTHKRLIKHFKNRLTITVTAGSNLSSALKLAHYFDPAFLASVTFTVVMRQYFGIRHSSGGPDYSARNYHRVIKAIGDNVDTCRHLLMGLEENPKYFRKVIQNTPCLHKDFVAMKLKGLTKRRGRKAKAMPVWNEKDKRLIGDYCLKSFMTGFTDDAGTPYMNTKVYFQKGVQKEASIVISKALSEGFEECFNDEANAEPVTTPMVIKPKPWKIDQSLNITGGYRYTLRRYCTFMGSKRHKYYAFKDNLKLLQDSGVYDPVETLSGIFSAMNTLQNTAYKVNEDVLGILVNLSKSQRRDTEHIIPRENEDDIKTYLDIEAPRLPDSTSDEDKVANIQRRKELANERLLNDRRRSKRQMQIRTAQDFAEYDRIYFPWRCDYRGRLHLLCNPSGLSPQSDDVGKGLLLFEQGSKVSKSAAYELACYGATLYDTDSRGPAPVKLSKLSNDEKIQWINNNENWIKRIAANPLNETDWIHADGGKHAVQFLAWCFDYAGYLNDPENHESNLIVHLDGSCNSCQHASLMLLDRNTAQETNVITSLPESIDLQDKAATRQFYDSAIQKSVPNDLYIKLGSKVNETIRADIKRCKAKNHGISLMEAVSEYVSAWRERAPIKETIKTQKECPFDIDPKYTDDLKAQEMYYNKRMKRLSPLVFGTFWMRWDAKKAIQRSIAKSPVMVYGYGSTLISAAEDIQKYIEDNSDKVCELSDWDKLTKLLDDRFYFWASLYLAEVFFDTIKAEMQSIANLREWMNTVAIEAGKQNKPLCFISPAGFPLIQNPLEVDYANSESKRPLTLQMPDYPNIGPKQISVYDKPIFKLDKGQLRRSLSPNITHAMDSAHLIRVIEEAFSDERLRGSQKPFTAVHDSFGCLASDASEMRSMTAYSMTSMYSTLHKDGGPLEKLLKDSEAVFGLSLDDIPPPPMVNTLTTDELWEACVSPFS